jgi:hypothetical protein
MKKLIQLAYTTASGLFSETNDISIVVKMHDDREFTRAELTAVMQIIEDKLTFLSMYIKDDAQRKQNLHYIILYALKMAYESYQLQNSTQYLNQMLILREYATIPDLPDEIKQIVIEARKFQHINFITQQEKKLLSQQHTIVTLDSSNLSQLEEIIELETENATLRTDNKYLIKDHKLLENENQALKAQIQSLLAKEIQTLNAQIQLQQDKINRDKFFNQRRLTIELYKKMENKSAFSDPSTHTNNSAPSLDETPPLITNTRRSSV